MLPFCDPGKIWLLFWGSVAAEVDPVDNGDELFYEAKLLELSIDAIAELLLFWKDELTL